jgi:hypothetical protein
VATVRLNAAVGDIELAMVDGHLEDAWARFNEHGDRADELGVSVRVLLEFLMAPSLYLGRAQRWLAAFNQHIGPASVVQPGHQSASSIRLTAGRALCLAQVGRIDEAQTLVAPLLDNIEGMDDELPIGPLAFLLQSAVVVEHWAAQALAERLACVAHLNGDTVTMRGCVARHLGDAAALVGDRTAARGYYAQALESAGKIGFRPELALTHLRLAELLLKEATMPRGRRHLNSSTWPFPSFGT